LRILEQEAGLKVSRVSKIQRQRNNPLYKRAVRMAAEGKADEALYRLDRMGDVVEISDGKARLQQLVGDYVGAIKQKRSALIVSPTHIEGQNVTDSLRHRLKEEGQIDQEERRFLRLKSTNWTEEHKKDPYHYRQGKLSLEFHQNARGHVRGERWEIADKQPDGIYTVTANNTDGERGQIDLKQAGRFTV
jgi:hypothetical protein